jgi:hypothetical protein
VDWGSVVFRRLQLKACELIRRLEAADCQILAALGFRLLSDAHSSLMRMEGK